MKALHSIYSPIFFQTAPFLLLPFISCMRQELSIFVKRYSQSLTVHREDLQRSLGRRVRDKMWERH